MSDDDEQETEMYLLGWLWPGWEPAVIALDGSMADGTRVQDKVLGHKKAGRIPVREYVGPAKNLLMRRTEKRPARHEDTMRLCWYFLKLMSKRA